MWTQLNMNYRDQVMESIVILLLIDVEIGLKNGI